MSRSTGVSRRRWVRRSEEEWRELFSRFQRSGQTREQFCAEQDVVLSSFSRWWRKLEQATGSEEPVAEGGLFVELASNAESTWDVELQLGSGVVLRLRRSGC